jgi:hypothetical protein
MTTPNTESTLAIALGVSGVITPRAGISPITPLTMIWRRQLTPADALLSAITTQAGSALAERTVNVLEGQWLTLDASGNAVIADAASGGGAQGLAWPCWSGGSRMDLKGGLTVLHGSYVADTSFFDSTGSYAVGTMLQIGTGTVQGAVGTTGCLKPITIAAVADLIKVVARVERAPYGVSPQCPAGLIRISRAL